MYTTMSPCIDCAKLMINAGVSTVIYLEEYRDTAPLDLLSDLDIAVWNYNALVESQV